MTRITTGGPSFHSLPPRAGTLSPQVQQTEPWQDVQTVLFGAQLPKVLDISQFPQLAEQMRWLKKQKTKLAEFAGDADAEYEIVLAEGRSACIDPEGRIYLGAELVDISDAVPELLIGVLAHEVGHRPKTWKAYPKGQGRQELAQLARDEEAKADRFAGRALAALGCSPAQLCNFLRKVGHFEKQPENYYPVETRVQMIIEAHAAEAARTRAAQKLFPHFHRSTNVKDLIHQGERPSAAKRKRKIKPIGRR
jgi:hypothetical protein